MPPRLGDLPGSGIGSTPPSRQPGFRCLQRLPWEDTGSPYLSGQKELGFGGGELCPHLGWSALQAEHYQGKGTDGALVPRECWRGEADTGWLLSVGVGQVCSPNWAGCTPTPPGHRRLRPEGRRPSPHILTQCCPLLASAGRSGSLPTSHILPARGQPRSGNL